MLNELLPETEDLRGLAPEQEASAIDHLCRRLLDYLDATLCHT